MKLFESRSYLDYLSFLRSFFLIVHILLHTFTYKSLSINISQINEEMVTALSLAVYNLDGDGRTCEIMTQPNVSKY